MLQPHMYYEFAHLWPLISDPAGFAEDARLWREAMDTGQRTVRMRNCIINARRGQTSLE